MLETDWIVGTVEVLVLDEMLQDDARCANRHESKGNKVCTVVAVSRVVTKCGEDVLSCDRATQFVLDGLAAGNGHCSGCAQQGVRRAPHDCWKVIPV